LGITQVTWAHNVQGLQFSPRPCVALTPRSR
jgi:hypothetical protein